MHIELGTLQWASCHIACRRSFPKTDFTWCRKDSYAVVTVWVELHNDKSRKCFKFKSFENVSVTLLKSASVYLLLVQFEVLFRPKKYKVDGLINLWIMKFTPCAEIFHNTDWKKLFYTDNQEYKCIFLDKFCVLARVNPLRTSGTSRLIQNSISVSSLLIDFTRQCRHFSPLDCLVRTTHHGCIHCSAAQQGVVNPKTSVTSESVTS